MRKKEENRRGREWMEYEGKGKRKIRGRKGIEHEMKRKRRIEGEGKGCSIKGKERGE